MDRSAPEAEGQRDRPATIFPNSPMPLNIAIEVRAPKPLGLTAIKIYVHERARALALYHQPITCDAEGRAADGAKIAVNTVGRWLFGVPGYGGRIRVVAVDDNVLLYYPKESPKLVHELISSLKAVIETGQ